MNEEKALIINARTTDHISQQTRAWGYLEGLEQGRSEGKAETIEKAKSLALYLKAFIHDQERSTRYFHKRRVI